MAFKIPDTVDAVTGFLATATMMSAVLALTPFLVIWTETHHNVALDRLWVFPVITLVFAAATVWSYKVDKKQNPDR